VDQRELEGSLSDLNYVWVACVPSVFLVSNKVKTSAFRWIVLMIAYILVAAPLAAIVSVVHKKLYR